jgi:hypothetical protein
MKTRSTRMAEMSSVLCVDLGREQIRGQGYNSQVILLISCLSALLAIE